MAQKNRIKNVAIVGAGGNSGKFMTEALLKTGNHTVTAITRIDSTSELPAGVITKRVDYSRPETLVEALRGQNALVITLSGFTPKETDMLLVNAADTANEALVKDVFVFQPKPITRKAISDLGKSSYISVSTGFWYEWSLGIPAAFGFDFENRAVTYFDEGDTKISVSTWPQVGRAVAAILSLPIVPEGSNPEACLENYKNKVVYINSFTISQKDMLQSALRVTGTQESEWTFTKDSSVERYTTGNKEIAEGKRVGFAKLMYTRVFYNDGCGDFENNKGTLNGLLGLPREDIDEATKIAIERSKSSHW